MLYKVHLVPILEPKIICNIYNISDGFASTRPGYDIVTFIIRPVETFATRINPVHDYLTIIIHTYFIAKSILRVWRQPMPTAQTYMIVNQVNKQ